MLFERLFKAGARVPHRKHTAESPTQVMGVPAQVVIPMLQHIGVIQECQVAKGDTVKVGQILGDSQKPMGAPIHSPVSGTVTEVAPMLYAGGMPVLSVQIATDGLQTLAEGLKPPTWTDKPGFLAMVKASGLVGLGGAGFPAHIKLNPPVALDTLILNGAECEPYITSDYRVMVEDPQGVIDGALLVAKELGIPKILVGIEDNKPKAIEALRALASGTIISVKPLPSRYPQGAEKVLIHQLTGRRVPSGKLPSDVGVLVMNVTSAAFLASYVKTGIPLIKKRVTVDGPCVQNPKNLEVLIGTRIGDVFDFAGGFKMPPTKVLMGGPMMGVAQHNLETSVVKQTNALLALEEKEGDLPDQGACIRCGRCAGVCPMSLLPLELNKNALRLDLEALQKFHIMDCIECGSCSFVCPAKIHLVQGIRLGKSKIRMTTTGGKK